MNSRLICFAALAALTAAGAAQEPPAKQPPPAKAEKSSFSASVLTLNTMFQKDGGALGKKYVGKVVTVSGKVKAVTAAPDGGQTLALSGLPPTPTEPAGCTVPFPAGHPSLAAVKGLAAGAVVQVKGEIDSVTGAAFTLKNPVLLPAAGAGPVAKGPGPKRPGAKQPDPQPKAAPVPTMTTVDLSTQLRDDKTDKLWLTYAGKEVELTGEVEYSGRSATEKGGWALGLLGCESRDPELPYSFRMHFRPDSPDLARLRNLSVGDRVTVRGEFGLSVGVITTLSGARLVSGGEKPPAPLTPVRTADAEAFVKELLADRPAADKLRGQVVALTGVVSGADPKYYAHGLSLRAGKLKPADLFEVSAACVVVDDQLDAVWQLPPGQKVRVVGRVGRSEKDRVRLVGCRVELQEPNPMPTVTAAELVAAFQADPKAAAAKYGDAYAEKWLFVTGEVAAVTPKKFGVAIAVKVPAGPKVELLVDGSQADGLKAGAAVRFKAVCQGLTDDKTAVRLRGDVLPEAKTALPMAK
ncbi:hypothetical protein R5W23_003874 [Gemmata sp. JC673]|uniref:DUF5666 domain-containing protein n=1 Tax=Gemmata algarum TaxID=2975278 RepID=A0ABU5F7U4_9BACT|nr:hypothetical protein [Gemmata algarum]MDY3562408.1 hypothetical protein [Gemmata algarum]